MILRIVSSLLVALILGIGSAWIATGPLVMQYPLKNGAWRTSANLGNKGDEMYLRAYSARIAWFSNDPDRSIYWVAEEDSAGAPLDGNCAYTISGRAIAARWWSITAYRNLHWIANSENRYSFANTNIKTAPDGSWVIDASAAKQGENWLPLGESGGRVSFVLRLYDPADALFNDIGAMDVPAITKGACK